MCFICFQLFTNSELSTQLKQKYSEFECTKKRVASANAKLKHEKGSLVTIMRYAMVLNFLKANHVFGYVRNSHL